MASSALAERLPRMCGSATLAMEVSNTSMKVASVTVMAITQGLIEPPGMRNLLVIFSNMAWVAANYSATTVTSAFIPGRKIAVFGEIGSRIIFTGMRWTTFT